MMINKTVLQLPAPMGAGTASLSLSVLDSSAVPVPLQPGEASRLCTSKSLVVVRESKTVGAQSKVAYQDVLLGDANFDDVMGSLKEDLGTPLESVNSLLFHSEGPAQRLASLKQFILVQMDALIKAPDMQFFGLSALALQGSGKVSSGASQDGSAASKGDGSMDEESRPQMLLVAPSLMALIQGALAFSASSRDPAASSRDSTSGAPSSKRSSSGRIPRKKKNKPDVAQSGSGSVPSIKDHFPSVSQDEVRRDNTKSSDASVLVPGDSSFSADNGSSDIDLQVRCCFSIHFQFILFLCCLCFLLIVFSTYFLPTSS